jgi:threonine dehydratase
VIAASTGNHGQSIAYAASPLRCPGDDLRTRGSEHVYRYVHSGNEPLLIAGVGTETLEILEEQPQTDVIVVPVGGAAARRAPASSPRRSIRRSG